MYNNWNKTKINEQIKQTTKSFYEKPSQELAIIINTLEDLKSNKTNIFTPEDKFDEQLAYDKSLVHDNSEFMPFIEDFTKYDDILGDKGIKALEERNIPNRLLTSFLHDFYNSIDREFAKYFNRVFKERHNNLRITSNNSHAYNRNYIVYLDQLNYAYINIYRTNTIDDFVNIVHEYAHAIADQMRYRSRYGKYPFIELLPLFMQELAYDEIIRCYEDVEIDVVKADLATTKTILKYAKELMLQKEYLAFINPSIERKQFVNNFAEYSNNTKSKTEKILNMTMQEKLSYVIPFITMVELYDLYYKDPKKALHIIKRIITMDERDNYIAYLEKYGIHLNEHMNNYIGDQKKLIKLTQ